MAGYVIGKMTVKSNNVIKGQSFARKDKLQNNHLRLVESLQELDHWNDFMSAINDLILSVARDINTKDFAFYRKAGLLSRHTRKVKGMLDYITPFRDQDAIDLIADNLHIAPLQVVSLLSLIKAVDKFNNTKKNISHARHYLAACGKQQVINRLNGSAELDAYYWTLSNKAYTKLCVCRKEHIRAIEHLDTSCIRFWGAICKVSATAHNAHIKPTKMNSWHT